MRQPLGHIGMALLTISAVLSVSMHVRDQVEELVARARVAFGHLSVHNVPAIYYE